MSFGEGGDEEENRSVRQEKDERRKINGNLR
jgi:hypothetical protein